MSVKPRENGGSDLNLARVCIPITVVNVKIESRPAAETDSLGATPLLSIIAKLATDVKNKLPIRTSNEYAGDLTALGPK